MINIVFCSYPDYSGNARTLYDFMKKKFPNFKYTWVVRGENHIETIKQNGDNLCSLESRDVIGVIEKADVIFSTHADLARLIKKPIEGIYIELWHGVSPKNMGYLIQDISQKDKEWCDTITKNIDYYIVPSKFWVPIFSARFHAFPKQCLPLGFPMFDDIINSAGKRNLEKALGIDTKKYKKIIYYMPTVKQSNTREEKMDINQNNIFNIKKYSETELIKFLKDNNYLLCVKYHPSEEKTFPHIESDYIRYISQDDLEKYDLDTNKILNASDLLITDFSSLGLHYLFLNKPIIYLDNEVDNFNNSRGVLFGDFSFWTGKQTVDNFKDLKTMINRCIDKPLQEELIERKNIFFKDVNDKCCQNICDYLFEKDRLSTNIKLKESKKRKISIFNSNR